MYFFMSFLMTLSFASCSNYFWDEASTKTLFVKFKSTCWYHFLVLYCDRFSHSDLSRWWVDPSAVVQEVKRRLLIRRLEVQTLDSAKHPNCSRCCALLWMCVWDWVLWVVVRQEKSSFQITRATYNHLISTVAEKCSQLQLIQILQN